VEGVEQGGGDAGQLSEQAAIVQEERADASEPAGAQDATLDVRPDEALDVDRQPAVSALVAVAVDRQQGLEVVDDDTVRGGLARVPPAVSLDSPATVGRHAVTVRDADAFVGDSGQRGGHGPPR